MGKNIAKEMERLKKEIYQKKEEIRDIKKLVHQEIDREFPPNLEDFSERELETRMEEQLSFLDKSVNPMPDKMSLSSHRKIAGRPIIWLKRILLKFTHAYISLILGKQKIFNQKCVALYQTLIFHQKKNRKKITLIEERVSECEVHLDVISRELKELDPDFKKPERLIASNQTKKKDK